jgi:hypothetical protein
VSEYAAVVQTVFRRPAPDRVGTDYAVRMVMFRVYILMCTGCTRFPHVLDARLFHVVHMSISVQFETVLAVIYSCQLKL